VLIVASVVAVPSSPAAAQTEEWTVFPSRMLGRVVDADRRGRPVGNVTIRLHAPDGTVMTGVSDRDGRFSFPALPPGDYLIEGEHIAYATAQDTVPIDGSGRAHLVELRLRTRAIPHEPVEVRVAARPVTGVLQPVYDRIESVRLWGGGHVLDRSDIERRISSRASLLLEMIPGVRIEYVRTGGGSITPVLINRRVTSYRGYCVMSVYVDGARVITGGGYTAKAIADQSWVFDADQVVRANEIEAIEVYHPSQRIPTEYTGSYSGCGVILIWTRRA
jgi:hypothetical protein